MYEPFIARRAGRDVTRLRSSADMLFDELRRARAGASPRGLTVALAAMLIVGCGLLLETDETISTKDHHAGDTFDLTVMQNVLDAHGQVLIPAGSRATGLITEAAESTGSDSPAVLRFTVADVLYEGTPVELTGEIVEAEIQGDSRTSDGRTAAIIAGGAAAGTAYWLVTRDGHAELPEGSTLTFFLNEPVVIR